MSFDADILVTVSHQNGELSFHRQFGTDTVKDARDLADVYRTCYQGCDVQIRVWDGHAYQVAS